MSTSRRALEAEIARLSAKLSASSDADVRAGLKSLLEAKKAELEIVLTAEREEAARLAALAESEASAPTPTATISEVDADQEVRRAVVMFNRGEREPGMQALRDILAKRPDHVSALETLADFHLKKHQSAEARELLGKAHKLRPQDARLERKYAELVLSIAGAGDLDQQMRAHLSDDPLLDSEDAIASRGGAIALSAILPGSGHLVLGRTKLGVTILVIWISLCVWVAFMAQDVVALGSLFTGGQSKPNLLVTIPLFLLLVVWILTLNSLNGRRAMTPRKSIAHPKPPADLPFE